MDTYLTDELERGPNESAEDHYTRMTATRIAVEMQLSLRRCIDCEFRSGTKCTNFNADIGDYLYEPNDCEAHRPDIPF